MNKQEHLETLSEIKTLMERSSRFISLSGRSGIFIGMYALMGASVAWWFFDYRAFVHDRTIHELPFTFYMVDALIVLALSLSTGYVFSKQLANNQGNPLWDSVARRMAINLFIPLITGAAFCFLLIEHKVPGLIAPSMLIFYGLALLNASKYTHDELRYMGIAEVLTGLAAACFADHGIYFWAFGFGVLHIAYGISMYLKYER